MSFSRFTKRYLSVFFTLTAFFAVGTTGVQAAAPVKLTTLAAGETVGDYQVSPNGAYAVYRRSHEVLVESEYGSYTSQLYDLYSVRLSDKLTKKLNPAPVAGGEVTKFQISSDSARVVYVADQQTDNLYEIYTVAIGGGTAKKLNPAFAANCDSCSVDEDFQLTPDGRYAVFQTEIYADDYIYSFYSAPIAGGSAAKTLTQGLPAGEVDEYKIAPDSSRIVYAYEDSATYTEKLYSVAPTGGAPKLLTGVVNLDEFAFTPDSQTVFFVDDLDGYDNAFSAQLFSVGTKGGAVRPISLSNETVVDFRVTNKYNAVVYTTKLVNQTVAFTIASTDGSDRYTIGTELRVQDNSLVITSDDRALVFGVSRQNGYSYINEIYSISIASRGTPVLLSQGSYPEYSIGASDFKVTPDGQRVLFIASKRGAYLYELFSVPVAGGTIVQLNNPFDASRPFNEGRVSNYKISADSKRVVFSSEPYDASGTNQSLFSNSTTGGAVNFIGYGNGYDAIVLPNSRGVVFGNSVYDENTYSSVTNLYKAIFP